MVLQLFLDLQLPPVISELVSTEIIIIILFFYHCILHVNHRYHSDLLVQSQLLISIDLIKLLIGSSGSIYISKGNKHPLFKQLTNANHIFTSSFMICF